MNTRPHTTSIAGKICLVTGATGGIGKEIATGLAAQGAVVIAAGRNQIKAEAAAQQIKTETGNEEVQALWADFSDLQQIRALAAAFKERYPRLDVLINNAGAFFFTRKGASNGLEMTFLVNHLAPFLLTNLLLDVLKSSAPARILNVSSEAHRQGSLDFDDLGFQKGYSGIKAYGRSKLANILHSNHLSHSLANSGVTVNALHPGFVATDLWRPGFSWMSSAFNWIMGFFALTPEAGADNSIYLASSLEVEGVTGRYFVKRKPAQPAPIARDKTVAQKLWDCSAYLTALGH